MFFEKKNCTLYESGIMKILIFGLVFILSTMELESHGVNILPWEGHVHPSDLTYHPSQLYRSKRKVENSTVQNPKSIIEQLKNSPGGRSGTYCKDNDRECTNYSKHCRKLGYVRKYCPKSCGLCTFVDIANCKDDKPSLCKGMDNHCSKKHIKEMCQHTCGVCSNKCEDIWMKRKCMEVLDWCSFNKEIQSNCKKTCQLCVVDSCLDNDEKCFELYKEYCESLIFVQHLCPKTCGICDKETVVERQKGRGCDCGLENTHTKPQSSIISGHRIVGGSEAEKNRLPWMVYIANIHEKGTPRCGGSILNNRYVLTAAHCTYKRNCKDESEAYHFLVTVAEHIIDSINDDVPGVTEKITVEKIIRHEKYCKTPGKYFDNDIALFRLSKDIELLEYPEIGIICLPNSITDDFYSKSVLAAGWGYILEGSKEGNILSPTLQVVKFNRYSCGNFPDENKISDNMICGGDTGNVRDACGGDSGGPLTVRSDLGDGRVRHVQIGIVSFGVDEGTCTGWGVYTKVQNYLDWIKNHTQDGSCDNVTSGGYQTMPNDELERYQGARSSYRHKGITVTEDVLNKCECGLPPNRGGMAKKNIYPWLVYIQKHESSHMSQLCAGSIINDLYILTAGHCTYKGTCEYPYDPQDLTVTVTEHNNQSLHNNISQVTEAFTVEDIIRHENFCKSAKIFDSDIALLKLHKRLDFISHEEVGVVCLPEIPVSEYDNTYAAAAEWGLITVEGNNNSTSELNEVELIKLPDCALYPSASDITENMICAGYNNDKIDTCGGDSGGPLFIRENDGRYIQIGIVSFRPPGIKCSGLGVFTDVYKFLSWIREKSQDGTCG